MPYFIEQAVKRITVPSNADYWVDVVADFRWKETKQFVNVTEGQTIEFASTADKVLLTAIKEWNLDNPDGTTADITADSIDKLEQADVLFILNELNLQEDDTSKKNSLPQ